MRNQKTAKGFTILSAAGMIVKILSLLYIPFLIMLIGHEGYGIYSAAYQIYTFIFVLTNSGVPIAISKLVSELVAVGNYKDAVKSFKISRLILITTGIVMALIMLVLARPLSNVTHYSKSYYSILALAPAILLTSSACAYRGYFQGRENMAPIAISQILEQIANSAFTLVFAWLLIKYGVEMGCVGGTLGTTIGAFVSAAYLVMYYKKHNKFPRSNNGKKYGYKRMSNKRILAKIISYGLPITICVGMTYAGNIVDLWNTKSRLLTTNIFTDAQASAMYGILVKYQQLLNVPIAIISALSAAVLPAISAAVARADRKDVKDKVTFSFKTCFLVALPSAVGFAILSRPIFVTIFGIKNSEGSNLLLLGSIVLVLTSIVQIQTTILQSIGKLYTATFYSFLGIVGKITANYFLISIPSINITGAVLGSMVGFAIPLILNHIVIQRSLRVKVNLFKISLKPLIASIAMGICVFVVSYAIKVGFGFISKGYFMYFMQTAVSVILGAFIYVYVLIINGGIRKKDLESLPGSFTRFIPKVLLNKVR